MMAPIDRAAYAQTTQWIPIACTSDKGDAVTVYFAETGHVLVGSDPQPATVISAEVRFCFDTIYDNNKVNTCFSISRINGRYYAMNFLAGKPVGYSSGSCVPGD